AKPCEDVTPILDRFEINTVTLDNKGTVKERHKGKANYFAEHLADRIFLDMIQIPGGTFMIGSPVSEKSRNGDEGPQHQVKVPMFYMGKFEVTQAQWRAVASLPKVNKNLNPTPSTIEGDDLPVDQVSWEDAMEFCAR